MWARGPRESLRSAPKDLWETEGFPRGCGLPPSGPRLEVRIMEPER